MGPIAITVERVTGIEQCQLCYELAREVWGDDAACSTAQMKVHATLGGVVLLARDGTEPIGFLFSFPALYQSEWVLWSHETAVKPAYLHQGIGHRLKLRQRELAAGIGFRTIAWTFDPLVSRNAHFNISKLGAKIAEYKVNFYGTNEHDLVNQGVETDRFVAVWPSEPPESHGEQSLAADKVYLKCSPHNEPILVPERISHCGASPAADVLSTQIPRNMDVLLASDPSLVRHWRFAFRQAALELLQNGYQVTAFDAADGRSTYIWRRNGGAQ